MTYRKIGQDATITIGGTPVQAFARSVKVNNKVTTVDVRGIGDNRKQLRPAYGETSVVVELLIESTGAFALTMGNTYTVVTDTQGPFTGVLTGNDFDAKMDDAQIQTITLECDADSE